MTTDPTTGTTLTINRTLVGTIALALMLAAGLIWGFVGRDSIWAGACLKVGLVMSAFWLAMPLISQRASWGQMSSGSLFALVGLALVLTGKRVDTRIVIPLLAGAAIATMVLRPRSRSK